MSQAGVSLKVEGLKKNWGPVEVLSDVNFEIEAGGFLTLLGPSGCGKSTALRLISGLDETSGGQIFIGGNDVSKLPAAERNLGMVFQNYALFPHMTIAENILYGMKIRKVSREAKNKALKRVAELMALGQLLDRKPGQLSGGQQQRVALARVLVSERPLVLMDEPLSNLDAKLRVEIRREIRSLNKTLGITIVYVTHDQSEALSMSDTVVLMNGGKVAQAGTPKALYEKPSNTFSAGFIGTPPMNLLDAQDVNVPESFKLGDGERMRDFQFGVRPEDLVYGSNSGSFSVKAKVIDIQYEGSVDLIHLETCSGVPLIISYSGDHQPSKGDEIYTSWDRDSAHLFSKKDGGSVSLER